MSPKSLHDSSGRSPACSGSRAAGLGGLMVLLFAASMQGGCYQRVTRATGFGADQYNVSEPYQQSGTVDDWFWGKPAQSQPGSRLPPSPSSN